jgi:hypothetical protein
LVGVIDKLNPLGAARRPAGELPVRALDAEPKVALQESIAEQAGATVVRRSSALDEYECRLQHFGLEPHALLSLHGKRLEN